MTQQHRLGRVQNHDPQSRAYAFPAWWTWQRSVRHRINTPALDQGWMNACTGFAGAQWLNCSVNIRARKFWNKFSGASDLRAYTDSRDARELYSYATLYDDFGWTYPPTDNGSSGLGVAKALHKKNVITEYRWTFDFAAFLVALQQQPVLIGTAWTKSMVTPDGHGVLHIGTDDLDGSGGHEYLGIGIDYARNRIRIRNSWGPRWGMNGDAYIGFGDMEKLLSEGGDCVIPVRA